MLLIVPQEKNQDTQQGVIKIYRLRTYGCFFGVRSNIYRPLKNDPVIIDNENLTGSCAILPGPYPTGVTYSTVCY
jgi:hypothetical protein